MIQSLCMTPYVIRLALCLIMYVCYFSQHKRSMIFSSESFLFDFYGSIWDISNDSLQWAQKGRYSARTNTTFWGSYLTALYQQQESVWKMLRSFYFSNFTIQKIFEMGWQIRVEIWSHYKYWHFNLSILQYIQNILIKWLLMTLKCNFWWNSRLYYKWGMNEAS